MRNTKQKELILSIINNSTSHLTAEEVYQKCISSIPNISLGTVYRNLNKLFDKNLIRRIKMPNNIDRYDKNVIHSHIVCCKCGKIDDVFLDKSFEIPIIKDYKVMDYDLCFNGICKKCDEKEN